MFSTGGNVLINIGPTSYGTISPIFEERLRQMGSWLKVNGESIYNSIPWKYQNDTINSNVWYVFLKKRITRTLIFFSILGTHHQKIIRQFMHFFFFGQVIQQK